MGKTDKLGEYCRLMLCRNFLAGEFFDGFFCPAGGGAEVSMMAGAIGKARGEEGENEEEAHMSPKATIHIVCHTPNPILGVTPRYNPLIPLFP